MGQGGYLWIINATGTTLKRGHQHSYQMDSWSFNDIPSQSMERFYIEYCEGIFKDRSDDAGEVVFELEGRSGECFELQVRWPFNDGECGLKVNWSNTPGSKYFMFPPAPPNGILGELGWIWNGYLSLLILEKGVKTNVPLNFPRDIVSDVRTLRYPSSFVYDKWMDYYSEQLGNLTLTGMTLPGTHDAGTYRPVSTFGTPWIRTQDDSLADQLQAGIRVLDLRVGQNSPGDYVIVHDVWRTSYSLSEALKEVTKFIDATSKEIVILDFHRFVNLGSGSYDYLQLKTQISSLLNGYCLAVQDGQGKALKSIWPTCGNKRVVVAWNTSNPDSYMWPGVSQSWYKDADSLEKLYSAVKSDIQSPHSGMWAACSFMASSFLHTPVSNAEDFDPTNTRWFFGGSEFCAKANIISVDFYREYSNIVQASIIANLMKA